MAARIRSLVNFITPLDEVSRDDLVLGDVVTVQSLDAATTYAWSLAFIPEGSTATFSGVPTSVTPGTFTVDKEGPYLVRLTVDATLPTENTQYVRLRALTEFGQLQLVAAGERRDDTGIIPVDIDVEGWANEENANLQTLLNFVKPLVSSGRLFYVDANDGTSNYADYSSIQSAIDAAVTAGASVTDQWVILVRPGTYTENLTFKPNVHVLGHPGDTGLDAATRIVQVVGLHTAAITADSTSVGNLNLFETTNTAGALVSKTGTGRLVLTAVRLDVGGTSGTQGPALDVTAGTVEAYDSYFRHNTTNAATRVAIRQSGTSTSLLLRGCYVTGPTGLALNPSLVAGVTATLQETRVFGTHASGVGVSSAATSLTIDGSDLASTSGQGLNIKNLIPGALAASMAVTIRFSRTQGTLTYDITGIAGTTALTLGAVDYTGLSFPGGPPTTQAATVHANSIYYDNTLSGLTSSDVQGAIDELSGGSSGAGVLTYHRDMPEAPASTTRYRGWVPVSVVLQAVRVYMHTVNSVGTYTIAVTNEATGNTVLAAATFNMNTLVAATVTSLSLTAIPADKVFAPMDRWTVALTSSAPGFNGVGVYFELQFAGSTSANGQDLSVTLGFGNATGGQDIVITSGDEIRGQQAIGLGGDVTITGGTATGGVANGGDIVLTPGVGVGGGTAGEVIVNGKLTVTGLIDPTGVVFEAAPPPSTGASEGAVFVSDGSGGLISGAFYFRPPSNAASIRLGAASRSQVAVASAESVDALSGILAIGQFAFAVNQWPSGATFKVVYVASVTSALQTATILLFNVTDSETVTGTTQTTSSTAPVKLESGALTTGVAAGNLKTTEKIYEVRLSITGSLSTDVVDLGTAFMLIT